MGQPLKNATYGWYIKTDVAPVQLTIWYAQMVIMEWANVILGDPIKSMTWNMKPMSAYTDRKYIPKFIFAMKL